jgi:hypothetical protein
MFRKLVIIPLGRWTRTSRELNNIKVDLANIDHCGTCAYEKVKNKASKCTKTNLSTLKHKKEQ